MMLMKKKIIYIYISSLHLYHTRARKKRERERERQVSGQTRGDIHKSKYIIRHEMLPWRTLHSYPDSFMIHHFFNFLLRSRSVQFYVPMIKMRNHIILKIPNHEK